MGALAAATIVGSGLGVRPLAAQTPPDPTDLPVVEHRLDNGMRLVVLPRPGVPTVSLVVTFEVGGMHETPGSTGIVHLLEHLLFKGSTRIGTRDWQAERPLLARIDGVHDSVLALERDGGDADRLERLRTRMSELEDSARALVVPNEFDRILSSWGARGLNATTTNEQTTYFVELPSNRLESWFALEAERMTDPVFREFLTERDVVMEERRLRVDTSPGGVLYEASLDAAWSVHPYRQPVVGTMEDLRSLTRAEVADYYRRYYGARNAVVAIVGGVDPQETIALAEHWFGPIRPGEPAPDPVFDEPEPTGPIRVEVPFDAEPVLRLSWHVPAADHPDTPALSLLTSLLTGGRTAVLHRSLVQESRSVTAVTASIGPGDRLDRLLSIDATPRSPADPAQVEAEILAALDRIVRDGVDPAALERVRNQVAAGDVRRMTSPLGLAFQLANSVALFDDWRETFRFADRLLEVTPDEVRRAAERWLVPDRRIVVTLVRPTEARR